MVDNWGETTILRSLDDVAALKETEGGPNIIHGSATPARNLSDAGLNDRYHLLVFPVLLCAGKGMFSDTTRTREAGVGRERDLRQGQPEPRLRRKIVPRQGVGRISVV